MYIAFPVRLPTNLNATFAGNLEIQFFTTLHSSRNNAKPIFSSNLPILTVSGSNISEFNQL